MQNRIFFVAVLCVVSCTLPAQTIRKANIDSLVRKYMQEKKGGMAIGTIQGRLQQTFYYPATGSQALPDSNTVFEIGHVTSTFTSALLGHLVVEGKVKIDDPLRMLLPPGVVIPRFEKIVCAPIPEEHLPPKENDNPVEIRFTPYVCFPDPEHRPKEILLCDLATHTSGLPRLPSNLRLSKNKKDPYEGYTVSLLYNFISNYHYKSTEHFNFRYSEAGLALLGQAIANYNHTSFDTLLKKEITVPLSMLHTSFRNVHALSPATGLRTTLPDMMKFLAANTGVEKTSLKDALDFTHNPRILLHFKNNSDKEAALGWYAKPSGIEGLKITWSSDCTNAQCCYIGFIEQTYTGVVVLTNTPVDVEKMGEQLLRWLNTSPDK